MLGVDSGPGLWQSLYVDPNTIPSSGSGSSGAEGLAGAYRDPRICANGSVTDSVAADSGAVSGMAPSERASALLQLLLIPGVGPARCRALVKRFGSAGSVLRASPERLEQVEGVGPRLAGTIARYARQVDELSRAELREARDRGVTLLAEGDDGYPPLFAGLVGTPPLLYCRGTAGVLQRPGVAIVGSRRCTSYGIEQAERFAGVLAQAGLTIVSGGARGIDTAAHRSAMRMGGSTTVVLGCGLSRVYPPENLDLFEQIAASGRGALVSELPMATPPNADNFPARNRIISALSLGVIVIEAGRKSGALITARLATEEHGREVMALPGRVDSAASEGCLDLLRQGGAMLVREPGDVLEALAGPLEHLRLGSHEDRYIPLDAPAERVPTGDDPIQSSILRALDSPMSIDDLLGATRLEAGEARGAITLLEMTGVIERRGGLLCLRTSRKDRK